MRITERLARATAQKYKPRIIGVTGSLGKTAVKQAIGNILRSNGARVEVMTGDGNSIYDMSRAILTHSGVLGSLLRLWFGRQKTPSYPEVIILEYPPAGSADLKARLRIAKPDILVIAGMGEVPENVEFYENETDVLKDIFYLVHSVPHNGAVIYNSEDKKLSGLEERTKARLISYGMDDMAAFKITSFEPKTETEESSGISFKIEYGGNFIPLLISGVSGKFYGFVAAASAAAGSVFGVNLVNVSESLRVYRGEPGVGRILKGLKDSWIIDESRDSSLWGTILALASLKESKSSRKVAVLGDILGVGKYAEPAHKEIGKSVAKIADILVTVGPRAKFIAEGAEVAGLSKSAIYSFDSTEDAGQKVQDMLQRGDLVLVKGSKFLKMEAITLEIIAEPDRAKELLVKRQ